MVWERYDSLSLIYVMFGFFFNKLSLHYGFQRVNNEGERFISLALLNIDRDTDVTYGEVLNIMVKKPRRTDIYS